MSFLVHDPSSYKNNQYIDPDAFVRDVHAVHGLLVLKFFCSFKERMIFLALK